MRRPLVLSGAFGLLLVLALPRAARAQYTCTTNNGKLTITKYTGTGGSVNIPASINGLPVVRIGRSAFTSCSSVTGVTIPSSVTSIEDYAFSACTGLTGVTIPASVTNIGTGTFYVCENLAAITVETLNTAYTSVDGVLFNKNQSVLLQYPVGKAGSYTIPNTVAKILDDAFGGGSRLSGITIPGSVTNIGAGAFSYCAGLASVAIPDGVVSVGSSAFYDCTGLASVTIPQSVTSIGDAAFTYCGNLTTITVDALNPAYCSEAGVLFNEARTVLFQCPASKTGAYTVPDTVSRIEFGAFVWCHSLTNIAIPQSVVSIGGLAFSGCENLSRMIIPSSVTRIEYSAFERCLGLTAVYFKGNAPSLGASVFWLDDKAILYYLPGTTGWSSPFGGRPAVLWNPKFQTNGTGFGSRTNGFGFSITGTAGIPIVLEACTDLARPVWEPLRACTVTNGSFYYSDPDWTNYSGRFYRIRSP